MNNQELAEVVESLKDSAEPSLSNQEIAAMHGVAVELRRSKDSPRDYCNITADEAAENIAGVLHVAEPDLNDSDIEALEEAQMYLETLV